MKKVILICSILLVSSFSSIQAQKITAGLGLGYGTEVSQGAIVLNGQYFFSDKLAAAPSFIFYFPEKSKYTSNGFTSESKSSLWEFNADVNYYFFEQGVVKLYGEGGLNISTVKSKQTVVGNSYNQKVTASDTRAGLNLGIGADFKASDKIIPFVIMKYTISDFDQLVLKGGIRFVIK